MKEIEMTDLTDLDIHYLIIQSLPEHIAVMDHTSKIVFVNQAWKQFADQNGLGLEAYGVGVHYIDLCEKAVGAGSEEAGQIAGQLRSLLTGEIDSFSIEYPCHSPDRPRWFRLNGSYFTIRDTRWVVVIHENITAFKQTALDLIRKENKLKGILASVPDAMIMYDASLTIVWSNEPARRIFGPHLEGRVCSSAFSKASRPCDNCIVLKTFADRQVHSEEYSHPDVDGKQRTFLCRSSVAGYDRNGNPSLVMEFLHDITRRKADEKEIRRLSQAVEHSPVSVVITDVDGTIEYVNPSFTEVTGYTREEALGKNPRILGSKRQSGDFYQNLWDTIRNGRVWRGEFENVKKNKDHYWESASISPIFNDKKEIVHFVAVKEDITEQKKMIHQLEQAKILAESSTRAKSNFLATMSHEIRTPMNAILGMSRLVLETALDDTQRRYVANVHNSAKALMAVINDILDFSRAEAGQLALLSQEFELTQVIDKIIRVMNFTAEEKNIKFSSRFRHPSPLFVIGDPIRLNQIVINLVSNALKYTPAGEVEIETAIDKEETDRIFMQISVRDTGIGMSAEQTADLFKPFSQADGSSSRKYGGTGLGLAIVKQLVTLMAGAIEVTSTPGEGSVFRVTLPFVKSAVGRDRGPLFPPSAEPVDLKGEKGEAIDILKGKKMLIVDDDETNREIIRVFLEKAGADACEAQDGRAAIDMLSTSCFDLVFMDIEMPGMDGYETSKRIRKIETPWAADVPILALTGYPLAEIYDKISAAGVNDHIEKPVSREQLFQKVFKWVPPLKEKPDQRARKYPSAVFCREERHSGDLINMKSGMAYIDHNQTLYIKMLKKFLETYAGKDRELLKAFQADDVQAMRFLLHNMKSIAGMIGAAELEKAAVELSECLKDESETFKTIPGFSNKMEAIGGMLQQVIASARTLLEKICPKASAPVKLMKTLLLLVRNHQPVECGIVLDRIKALDNDLEFTIRLGVIEKLINSYRFRDAENKIRMMVGKEV